MHNSRATIMGALDSALSQTISDLEVIVVDDGSTDGGNHLVAQRASSDPRVRLVQQENRGPSAARNVGVDLARAPYLAFLDADDRWLPQKLAKQLAIAGTGVVYTDLIIVGGPADGTRGSDHQELFTGLVFEQLARSNFVGILTVLAPTDLIRQHRFDESLRLSEDLDLWLRLAADEVPFALIREPLAEYRFSAGTPGRDSIGLNAARVRILRKLESRVNEPRHALVRERLAQERRVLAGLLRRRALESLLSHDLAGAMASVLASMRT
jgi:glycosyltransferase involved in cell wall biosynthesis